ncbi:hypothetical protein GCM10009765_56740 [Fodinicola feengrottensis]|uniref:Uncharacterized protein n=1 Tax=Fodinicola feengrottensis TaxID=435914 RepID=A0ABN2I7H7_9ACTN
MRGIDVVCAIAMAIVVVPIALSPVLSILPISGLPTGLSRGIVTVAPIVTTILLGLAIAGAAVRRLPGTVRGGSVGVLIGILFSVLLAGAAFAAVPVFLVLWVIGRTLVGLH